MPSPYSSKCRMGPGTRLHPCSVFPSLCALSSAKSRGRAHRSGGPARRAQGYIRDLTTPVTDASAKHALNGKADSRLQPCFSPAPKGTRSSPALRPDSKCYLCPSLHQKTLLPFRWVLLPFPWTYWVTMSQYVPSPL